MHYDPEIAPDPAQWLALDEQERILLAEAHHRDARVKLPAIEAHAMLHAILENQIAEGVEPVVRAVPRLMAEGLSRHDALHAIGSVLAEFIFNIMQEQDVGGDAQAHYNAAVERLTAKEWRRQFGL